MYISNNSGRNDQNAIYVIPTNEERLAENYGIEVRKARKNPLDPERDAKQCYTLIDQLSQLYSNLREDILNSQKEFKDDVICGINKKRRQHEMALLEFRVNAFLISVAMEEKEFEIGKKIQELREEDDKEK